MQINVKFAGIGLFLRRSCYLPPSSGFTDGATFPVSRKSHGIITPLGPI